MTNKIELLAQFINTRYGSELCGVEGPRNGIFYLDLPNGFQVEWEEHSNFKVYEPTGEPLPNTMTLTEARKLAVQWMPDNVEIETLLDQLHMTSDEKDSKQHSPYEYESALDGYCSDNGYVRMVGFWYMTRLYSIIEISPCDFTLFHNGKDVQIENADLKAAIKKIHE